MNTILKKKLVLLLLLPLLSSCIDTNVRPEQTWFDIYLEDSPADYQNILLTFSSADIFNGNEWVGLSIKKTPISILTLTGGVNDKIVSQPLAAGRYTKLRLNIDETGSALKYLDVNYKMGIPEQYQSVEIPIDVTVLEGEYNYIYCDVDAAASVHRIDDSTFQMKPVFRISNSDYGAVKGSINDIKGAGIAQAMLITFTSNKATNVIGKANANDEAGADAATVISTYTNAKSGIFFARLPSGSYLVNITPATGSTYSAGEITSVAVNKGKLTSLGKIELKGETTETPGTP